MRGFSSRETSTIGTVSLDSVSLPTSHILSTKLYVFTSRSKYKLALSLSPRDLFLDLSLRQPFPPFDKQGWTRQCCSAVSLQPTGRLEIFPYRNLDPLIVRERNSTRETLDKPAEVALQKQQEIDQKSVLRALFPLLRGEDSD